MIPRAQITKHCTLRRSTTETHTLNRGRGRNMMFKITIVQNMIFTAGAELTLKELKVYTVNSAHIEGRICP